SDYATLYEDFFYEGRGHSETYLGDKPVYARLIGQLTDEDEIFAAAQNQLRQLRWFDDQVATLLDILEAKQLLDNTIIIFGTDNGFIWGEHGLYAKNLPYEEAIRGPLFIRNPAWTPGINTDLVSGDLDVAPTILDLAGANPLPATDGISLKQLVEGRAQPRTELLIQGAYGIYNPGLPQAWVGIRTADNWKYIEYVTGERELYDLTGDPYELSSRHRDPDAYYQDKLAELAASLDALERPVAITTKNLPIPYSNLLTPASLSEPYSYQFGLWGGTRPYQWSVHDTPSDLGDCQAGLPAGLILSPSGQLSGTPEATGTYKFCIKVSDSTDPTDPQTDYRLFQLTVE
ncbi:MAG: sulfatase/phosphatase domain-containing protein, partial [Ardenticatenaceae bacterium]